MLWMFAYHGSISILFLLKLELYGKWLCTQMNNAGQPQVCHGILSSFMHVTKATIKNW